MTENAKFAACFSGLGELCRAKVSMLCSSSSSDDVRKIWKDVYNDEPPPEIEIVAEETNKFSLNADDDFQLFLMMARDTYQLHPSKPLQVVLCKQGEYKMFSAVKKELSAQQAARKNATGKPNGVATNANTVEHRDKVKEKAAANDNIQEGSESFRATKQPFNTAEKNVIGLNVAPNSNSNEMQQPICSRGQQSQYDEEQPINMTVPRIGSSNGSLEQKDHNANISANDLRESFFGSRRGSAIASSQDQPNNSHSVQGKHVGVVAINETPSSFSFSGGILPSIFAHNNRPWNPYDLFGNCLTYPHMQAAQRFVAKNGRETYEANSAQQDVACTSSDVKGSWNYGLPAFGSVDVPSPHLPLRVQELNDPHKPSSFPNHSFPIQAEQPRRKTPPHQKSFSANSRLTTPNPAQSFPFAVGNSQQQNQQQKMMQSQRGLIPLFLWQQVCKNYKEQSEFLPMTGSPTVSAQPTPMEALLATWNSYAPGFTSNPLPTLQHSDHRKRKTESPRALPNMASSPLSYSKSSKRMRSTGEHSNIEYHYNCALEYVKLSDEEKAQHTVNNAHKSHRKHLLHAVERSPNFLLIHRNDKYDEWSSEARDIYAICQPDKYHWRFLTLSKQGDVLCKRIMKRVEDLKKMSPETRPEWCPEDSVLEKAYNRAQERLSQLEKISEARGVADKSKAKDARKSESPRGTLPQNDDISKAIREAGEQLSKLQQLDRLRAHLRSTEQEGVDYSLVLPPDEVLDAALAEAEENLSRLYQLWASQDHSKKRKKDLTKNQQISPLLQKNEKEPTHCNGQDTLSKFKLEEYLNNMKHLQAQSNQLAIGPSEHQKSNEEEEKPQMERLNAPTFAAAFNAFAFQQHSIPNVNDEANFKHGATPSCYPANRTDDSSK